MQQLDNITILYKPIRHGYARINDQGILVITIPNKLKNNESFKNTLLEKGKQLLDRYNKKTHILTTDNESVLLFGERTPLTDFYKRGDTEITHGLGDSTNNKKSSPNLQQNLPIPPKNLPIPDKISQSPTKSPNLLKQILQEYATPILDHYSDKLGIKYRKLIIRKTKSKRGSCTYDQNISLNLNLVHLPTKYIQYVIIHEVCHLKIKNHSPKFWALVESFLPNYKTIRKEMKKIVLK